MIEMIENDWHNLMFFYDAGDGLYYIKTRRWGGMFCFLDLFTVTDN